MMTKVKCRECLVRDAIAPSTRCTVCRGYQRKWASKQAKTALKKGKCPRCKRNPRGLKYEICNICRYKNAKYRQKRRDNETAQNEKAVGNGQS